MRKPMQILLFTIVGLGLYFFSDWLLRQIEARRGSPLKHRSLVFFAIILGLSLPSFQLIQYLLTNAS